MRTVILIRAPIFNSFRRMVVHCARACCVPTSSKRRSLCSNTYVNEEKYERSWLARRRRAGAVGKEAQLLRLDAFFDLSTDAVEILIKINGVKSMGSDSIDICPLPII